MTAAPLPTAKLEAWRYSDIDAVASVWPVAAPEAIRVAAGESVVRLIAQTADAGGVVIEDYAVDVAAGGRCAFFILNSGGRLGRIAIDVTLHDGAHFELGGAIVGGTGQTLEIVTVVRHVEPNATSNQIVRSVLAGQGTGSFLGKVAVARDAQKTDAVQSVKAMLLDRTATANAKPELEIYADDVKCAHGATVGELDKQALFYLESRGLPPVEAKALLLQAFIAGAFVALDDDDARGRLEAGALAALEALL